MWKFIPALVALLISSPAFAAYWQGQTYTVQSRVQRNLVTDYGATCNGVANDTTAFLAFKAANQGSTPVTLNLPGHCVFVSAFGSDAAWPFDGVNDIEVKGIGADRTQAGIKSAQGMLLGSKSQYQDNNHSVRTEDANAGASCVTLKTLPAVTVSNVANAATVPATFTASVTGNVMTVTAVASGTIVAGAYVTNVNSDMTPFTQVLAYGTGGTTGVGGTGTYQVSISQASPRVSQTTTTAPASFTASVTTDGVMTVSSVTDGTIVPGMLIYSLVGGINKNTVKPYGTNGTTGVGGTGTYQLEIGPTSTVSSTGFIGNGVPRVTLNSTAGLADGDVLRLAGISTGGRLFESNGLQWIKVVDGTRIDLFQRDFNGRYISGGTGGGDHTSLFPVGSKVLMTGWSNQSYWSNPFSYPSNPHWFEYKTVTSTNSTTHEVCFDTPLEHSYKAEWPQYNTGSQFEVDPGGPATLYVYPPTWEASITFKDLTLDAPGQIYMQRRNATLNNVVMTGAACVAPTQNETHTWTDVDGSNCLIETDKIVKTWNVTNTAFKKIDVQSSSFANINVDGVTAEGWFGSGKKMTMQNSSFITLAIGSWGYGSTEETVCINCAASSEFKNTGDQVRVDRPRIPWSMSGGVITIPNAYNNLGDELQVRFMSPGSYLFWQGGGGGGTQPATGRAFKIIGVTQDLENTYVQTSEAGGFPTGTWTTSGLSVIAHPAVKLTTTNMTGDRSALVFNGCPAQSPMYSCSNFTSVGGATGGSTAGYSGKVLGVLDTFTFTNNVPYTGGGALTWVAARHSNTQLLKTDNTTESWGGSANGGLINTKLPSSAGGGTRTLTPAGATGTQSGDGLTPPSAGAVFGAFGGSLEPIFSANTPSDAPEVTVTLRTNQNLPP